MQTSRQSEDSNRDEVDSQFSEKQIYTTIRRIADFITMQEISIAEFWRSERNHASAADILSFCKHCGFIINRLDEINLKAEIFPDRESISLELFCAEIPFWKKNGNQMISDFLKKRSDQLIERLQSKDKKRAQSGIPRKKSNTSQKDLQFRTTKETNAVKTQFNTLKVNNSSMYLRKYRSQVVAQQKQLAQTIQKNKLDYEYSMLVKMSELNDCSQAKKSNQTYRAFKSAEGIIRVRVFNTTGLEREITLNQFDTIYKNFKKTIKQNKEWNFSTAKANDLQLKKSKAIQKAERQEELRNLLSNTLSLTKVLVEQIEIFRMKGIYGEDIP